MLKRLLSILLVFALLSAFLPYAALAADTEGNLKIVSVTDEIIGEGVNLYTYLINKKSDKQPVKIYVIELDLTNPYLDITNLIGAHGNLEERAAVSSMAAGKDNLVAAINGGFFIMINGRPIGTLIKEGELIASPNMRGDMPVFALGQDGKPVFGFFEFTGEVIASNGLSYPLFGINKPAYDLENGLSDTDHLTLYNRNWGVKCRGGDPNHPDAMVAIVENNIVLQVLPAKDAQFDIPSNGFELWGAGKAADFIRQNLVPGLTLTVTYATIPDYKKIKLSTGSNSFLVQQGRVANFQENIKGNTARTAVGYKNGGKTLYFFVAEKSPESSGIEQTDLARFMVNLGIEEGVNLDGGGSTTLVALHLGDFSPTLINIPKEGKERKIPDAIAIFNTAPPGDPQNLIINGPDAVVAGTSAEYTIKGYDTHFNPWLSENPQWDLPAGTKLLEENIHKYEIFFDSGITEDVSLRVEDGGISAQKKISVIKAADISALRVTPAEINAEKGQTISLAFEILTRDNRLVPVQSRFVTCETTIGQIEDGALITGQKRGHGKITASFNGLEIEIPVWVDCIFKDSAQSWAFNEIEDLASAGLVKGFDDGTFRPGQKVTRAEMTALLARLLKWPAASKEASFKDKLPDWAKNDISSGVAQKVVTGYPDGTFKPDKYITRAEMGAILDRALHLKPAKEKLDYKDAQQIPAWAKDSVAKVVAAGLMKGYANNTWQPNAFVTRAEMAAIISREMSK
jgi:hypothetical protein